MTDSGEECLEHIPDVVKTRCLESMNASGVDHRQRLTLLALRTADPWKRMTNILFHVKKMVENSLNMFQEMMRLINSMYDSQLRSVAMARVEPLFSGSKAHCAPQTCIVEVPVLPRENFNIAVMDDIREVLGDVLPTNHRHHCERPGKQAPNVVDLICNDKRRSTMIDTIDFCCTFYFLSEFSQCSGMTADKGHLVCACADGQFCNLMPAGVTARVACIPTFRWSLQLLSSGLQRLTNKTKQIYNRAPC